MKLTTQSIRLLVASVLTALTVVCIQACDSHYNQSQTENAMAKADNSVGANSEEEAEEATADFREERAEVVADLEQQQDELDEEIAQLKDRINHQSDKTSAALKRQLAELEKEHRDLAKDIDIAKNATQEAWQDIKVGFKKAGRTLGDSFEEVSDQLNNR